MLRSLGRVKGDIVGREVLKETLSVLPLPVGGVCRVAQHLVDTVADVFVGFALKQISDVQDLRYGGVEVGRVSGKDASDL